MATRRVKFVSRTSKDPTFTLRDGRTVKRNGIVEVDVREAVVLLRDPGASDDTGAEWISMPKKAE